MKHGTYATVKKPDGSFFWACWEDWDTDRPCIARGSCLDEEQADLKARSALRGHGVLKAAPLKDRFAANVYALITGIFIDTRPGARSRLGCES